MAGDEKPPISGSELLKLTYGVPTRPLHSEYCAVDCSVDHEAYLSWPDTVRPFDDWSWADMTHPPGRHQWHATVRYVEGLEREVMRLSKSIEQIDGLVPHSVEQDNALEALEEYVKGVRYVR